MTSSVARRSILALAILAVPLAAFAQQRPAPQLAQQPNEAHPILAERLVDLSSEMLSGRSLTTAQYRQAGLLLQAASRLSPSEPRYPRLRYEAMLAAGDTAAAIDALLTYSRLESTDLLAQAKLIELYAQRMETADAKLKYLRNDIVPNASVPMEVRSHAALLATRVLLERGDRNAATGALTDAVNLNPLNAEAQRLRYQLLPDSATPLDRLNALLAIVRAAPLDGATIIAVADELSRAGLGGEAVNWYYAGLALYTRDGLSPGRRVVLNYAAQSLINDNAAEAGPWIAQLIASDPSDPSSHLLRVALNRTGSTSEVRKNDEAEARAALTRRFNAIVEQAKTAAAPGQPDANAPASATASADASTSQPIDLANPSIAADKILERNDPELKDAFVNAATDLATLSTIYLDDIGTTQSLVEGLKRVLPADSPLLARLEGWLFLIQQKPDEARQRLTAVADRDPLAALGLVRLDSESGDPAAKALADSRARQLRSSNAHGLLGAIIASELLPRKTPLVLTGPAEAMRAVITAFPRGLLRLIDRPQNFYFVRAEPVAPAVRYGEPMFVRVSVLNASDQDLPIGPGALRPDLWIDAQTRGLYPLAFPATAYDQLGGSAILKPRQTIARTVRIDQAGLLAQLRSNPGVAVPVNGSVTLNPATKGGKVVPGAGGLSEMFYRLIEQSPLPVFHDDQQKVFLQSLATAPAQERVSLIDAAAAYLRALRTAKAATLPSDPTTNISIPPTFEPPLRSAFDALAQDPDLTARCWGTFCALTFTETADRLPKAKAAAADPYWLTRLLALAGARGLPAPDFKALATTLQQDKDPLVTAYATAALDELEEREAEAPAPATQP